MLVIDELGFVPFDRTGGELLFNAIASRHEQKSVIVTTNLAFSEWTKVFADDEKLTSPCSTGWQTTPPSSPPRGRASG